MIPIRHKLLEGLHKACRTLAFPDGIAVSVNPCHDARFGDYQTNLAMLAAKALGRPPRELAAEIIAALSLADCCRHLDVAGAGFINFHLHDDFVARSLAEMAVDPHHGIAPVPAPRRIVLDFSGPNTAKSMHVGHIRSTFLGDALARAARAVGHHVITDNHIGDWGTQFGKLIHGYKNFMDHEALTTAPIREMERLYREVNTLAEKDPAVLAAVRRELAALQAGDAENLRIWKELTTLSRVEFEQAYRRMDVHFDHQLGESFYDPMLPSVVEELQRRGVAEESEGAVCVFFREDAALKDAAPMIIRKSDGASLYATTDLATVRHRVTEWQTQEILYVTDARQQLHFKQLFATIQRWFGRRQESPPELRHVVFGSILGADKRPIKTRSGEPIKLNDLLDEAEARALRIIEEKNPDLTPEERHEAARVIGIGAIKYADLCQNRNLDYIFDWDKLLALQGNTAPYLIYAYVRTRSIFRSGINLPTASDAPPILGHATEAALARHLLQFGDTIHAVLEDFRPHLLTNYLYELAVRFSQFYEACPVLKAVEPERASRLLLCDMAGRTLKHGLDLLGIRTLEKM